MRSLYCEPISIVLFPAPGQTNRGHPPLYTTHSKLFRAEGTSEQYGPPTPTRPPTPEYPTMALRQLTLLLITLALCGSLHASEYISMEYVRLCVVKGWSEGLLKKIVLI